MCKVYVQIILLKCWSFPALGWHQKWNSRGTDAYLNPNKFDFILFPTSVFVGHRISTRTGMHVSEFLCGLWLQWFSGCCPFTISSACISSSCVETARLSSEFKDGFFFFSWNSVSFDWLSAFTNHRLFLQESKLDLSLISVQFIVCQGQHWLLVHSFTTSFEFRVGLLLLTQQEAHFWAKRASFHEPAVLETCRTSYTPSFLLCAIWIWWQRQCYLNFIFHLYVKSVVLVSADDKRQSPAFWQLLPHFICRAPSWFHMLSVFWNC